MADFWDGTPFYYWAIYIGGNQRSCSQPNLTTHWIDTVTSGTYNGIPMAWKLLPLWVGPQDPCEPGFGSYISTNTSTAYDQGLDQAASAYGAWTNTLGQSADTPIVYDMEYTGSTITSSCLAAIRSFINGWDFQLSLTPPQKSGVYTSTCPGDMDAFSTISHVPNFIVGANYSSGKSTDDLPCVPTTHWVHQQRHKQYAGPHNVTENGSTINVDSDCANSWVYATFTVSNTSEGCSG